MNCYGWLKFIGVVFVIISSIILFFKTVMFLTESKYYTIFLKYVRKDYDNHEDSFGYHIPSYIQLFLFVMAIMVSLIILYPFYDDNYLYAFEPDTHLEIVLAFANGQAFKGTPVPDALPYFDGPYVIYALVALVLEKLSWLSIIDTMKIPHMENMAICAIRMTSLSLMSLSIYISLLVFYYITRQWAITVLLAAYMLLCPIMLNIDFLRVDHVIWSLFIVTLWLTLIIDGSNDNKNGTFILLGIVTALLTFSKINAFILLIMPVLVCFKAISYKSYKKKMHLCGYSFGATSLLVMIRYLCNELKNPGFIIMSIQEKIEELLRWKVVLPIKPYLYYNYDQFISTGPVFIITFIISLLLVIISIYKKRACLYTYALLGLMFIVSIFGVASLKYPRGNYVLFPIYVITCAIGYASGKSMILHNCKRSNTKIYTWCFIFIIGAGLNWPIANYLKRNENQRQLKNALTLTKYDPTTWMINNVRPGARVTIFKHSEWANPPMDRLNVDQQYRFLDFPYKDIDALSKYMPPTLETVQSSTDIIILNDFHYNNIISKIQHKKEWEEFFKSIKRKYMVNNYKAQIAAYHVKEVDIIIVNPQILVNK